MARGLNRLSARTVQTAKEPGWYGDGGGLYLRVTQQTRGVPPQTYVTKRWVFVFQWQGRRAEMGLGSVTDRDLASAREARDAARQHVRDGQDPREAGKAAPAPEISAPTFGVVADELVASLKSGWKSDKHAKQWTATLKTHAAALWDRPVDNIDTKAVLDALTPIWGKVPETASRVRGRIEHVLDAAAVQGHRADANPARWKGHLQRLLPARQTLTRGHHPALPFEDMPTFWPKLQKRRGLAPDALQFTILTAVRTSEALEAVWREIDLEAKVWTIPAERMKGKLGKRGPHRVALSEQAVALLLTLRPPDPEFSPDLYVFPGFKPGKPLSNMSMEMVMRRMKLDDYTVHGFRSTFSDWAGETTAFPHKLVEAALAHVSGDKVERAYRRMDALEKRRELMQAWADYITPRLKSAPAKSVPVRSEQ